MKNLKSGAWNLKRKWARLPLKDRLTPNELFSFFTKTNLTLIKSEILQFSKLFFKNHTSGLSFVLYNAFLAQESQKMGAIKVQNG